MRFFVAIFDGTPVSKSAQIDGYEREVGQKATPELPGKRDISPRTMRNTATRHRDGSLEDVAFWGQFGAIALHIEAELCLNVRKMDRCSKKDGNRRKSTVLHVF